MTSKPASRRARATTLTPRSCPSSPGLATTTPPRSPDRPCPTRVRRPRAPPTCRRGRPRPASSSCAPSSGWAGSSRRACSRSSSWSPEPCCWPREAVRARPGCWWRPWPRSRRGRSPRYRQLRVGWWWWWSTAGPGWCRHSWLSQAPVRSPRPGRASHALARARPGTPAVGPGGRGRRRCAGPRSGSHGATSTSTWALRHPELALPLHLADALEPEERLEEPLGPVAGRQLDHELDAVAALVLGALEAAEPDLLAADQAGELLGGEPGPGEQGELLTAAGTPAEQVTERAQPDQGAKHENGRADREQVAPGPDRDAEGGGGPDAGRGGEPADGGTVAQDGPAAQEADAGDDLRRDPGRVPRPVEAVRRDEREQAGADGEQHVGAQAGWLVGELPLDADGPAQHGRQGQAGEELEIGRHGLLPSLGGTAHGPTTRSWTAPRPAGLLVISDYGRAIRRVGDGVARW